MRPTLDGSLIRLGRPRLAALASQLLLLLLVLATPCLAEAPRQILGELGERYEVIELSRGYGLRPLEERAFRLVEVAAGRIFVDGKAIGDEPLADLLGEEDAQLIRQLAGAVTSHREREPEVRPEVEAPEKPAPKEPAPKETEPSRPARRSSGGDDVIFGADRRVRQGEEAGGGMVLLGGRLKVERGGSVGGDVTVLGGGAEVAGVVKGTLVSIGGGVELKDGALVEGDVVSIGGAIRERGDARIEGQRVQIAFGDFGFFGDSFDDFFGDSPFGFGDGQHGSRSWGFSIFDLIGRFFRLGLLLVLIFAVVLIAPGRTASIAARVRDEPWRSGLIGLIVQVVFLPVFLLVLVVLLVSIIGIPLALVVPPLMVLALIAFFVVGYSGVAMATGGIIERRFDRHYSSYGLVLLGLLLIEGWSLLGDILVTLPGPIKLMAFLALTFGFFVQYTAWTVGLGAAVSDQVERRRRLRFAQPGEESGFVDHWNPE